MKLTSITRVPFRYGGTVVLPRAEFSAKSARDAKILIAAGRAVASPDQAPDPSPPAATGPAAMTVERKRRTYKRRDLVAETAAVEVAEPAPAAPVPPADAEQAGWPFPTTIAD